DRRKEKADRDGETTGDHRASLLARPDDANAGRRPCHEGKARRPFKRLTASNKSPPMGWR
ncbi:MAG TPA: hypothetical protein VKV96_19970, partial [Roseiarcus sp.]|nr:hypothetical protein [Roseiarcus sp.]